MTHQSHKAGLPSATHTIWQVAGTCGAGVLWAVGTPWWVRAICIVPAFGYAVVLAVFPQRSADRLAWWRDRRRHKEARRRSRAEHVAQTRTGPLLPPESPQVGR